MSHGSPRRSIRHFPLLAFVPLLGLLLMFTQITPTLAACPSSFPVTVPASDSARLIEVIGCANSNGGGTNDIINLTAGSTYTLTAINFNDTGLPPIAASNGTLTINGNGATIARSSAGGTPEFRLFLINNSANLTLNQVTLINGRLTGGSGGAINNGGTLRLVGSTIANNTANGGGGIANFSTGTITLRDSLLANNVAMSYGGAIANSGGTINVVNTTISGNAANGTGSGSGGGAIDIYGGSLAYVLFINSTIAYNTAVAPNIFRSGIWQESGKSSYFNTIVANNNGANNCNFAGGIWENNLNSLDNGTSCGFNGTWAANTDPMLAPLANNGGPTRTHALLPGSPAINHADDAYITEEDRITTLLTDQRGVGFPRNVGGLPDIGAYEVQCPAAFPATVPAGDSMRLIELIGCANSNGAGTNDVINLAPASTYMLSLALVGSNGLPAIVSASSNGKLTINGNGATITRSSAGGTPEFRLISLNAGANLTLSQMWLTNGLLSGGSGGAIFNNGTLTLMSSTIAVNNANFGAGLYNSNGSTAIIRDSLMANNVAATYGGAIVNSSATLYVVNSTISGNAANGTSSSGGGGAIDSFGASSAVSFYNSTVAYNTAVAPNAVRSGFWREAGTSFFVNSIIANNNGANNCLRSGGTGGTINNSNIENGNTCGLVGQNADPMLAPLAVNGGLTQTHALLPSSPAINGGNNSWAVAEDEITPLGTDQRGAGYPRIVGGTVDIGATESVCGTSNFNIAAGDTAALIEAINCANGTAADNVINLAADSTYTLTNVYGSETGLPGISAAGGALTINGNGATIQRSSAGGTPNFRLFYVSSGATLTLNTMTLTNGSVPGATGGAIYNAGTLSVNAVFVSFNTALGGGGIENAGSLTILNSTIASNSASLSGGGVQIDAPATIINSTLGGNSSPNGGAINSNASLTIINSTISDNSSADGAGLRAYSGTFTLNNSIIANSLSGPDCVNYGNLFHVRYSLIEDGLGCVNGTNVANLTGDPLLGERGVNGGLTPTYSVLPGSPVINAGSNGLAVDASNVALTTDQRGTGYPRIRGASVDMGATESECSYSFPHTVAAGDTADLIVAINCANGSPSSDVITLTAGSTYTLTTLIENFTGLPPIVTTAEGGALTINGNGATITRSAAEGIPQFRLFHVNENANLTLNRLTITGGVVGQGAGIVNAGGTLTINDSTISGNTAVTGAGITMFGGGSLTLMNSLIANNVALDYGGGLDIFGGTVTIVNSTISGNAANQTLPESGGAAMTIYNFPTVKIINSTITNNTASLPERSGIWVENTAITIQNSIVAGNNGAAGNCYLANGGAITDGGKNIDSGTTCGFGVGSFPNTNPRLAPLANNGGFSQTHALLPGSPAINAGSNALAVDANNAALTTDQRGTGFPRINNTTVDIGAFESVAGSINLQLTLQGRSQPAPHPSRVVSTQIRLLPSGGGAPLFSTTLTSNQSSALVISNIPVGTYLLRVKGSHTLARQTTITIVSGANAHTTAVLLEGDANDNNSVTLPDFSILATAFGKALGEAGYDARADFNGDNIVSINDFSLLASNFGTIGE